MKSLLAVLFAASASIIHAAPDTVDSSFAATAGSFFDAVQLGGPSSCFIQPDGKILLGSNEMSAQGGTIFLPLTRFNPDGTVDNTFHADADPNGSGSGIYYDNAGWPEVHGIAMQTDGKIIAVGCMQGMRDGISNAASANSLVSNGIVRILPDGTPDTSFQCAGIDTEFIDEVITTDDNKILIAGGFNRVRNQGGGFVYRYGIARLLADGSLDTTFEVTPSDFGNIIPNSLFIRQIAPAPGGKYYIAGSAQPVGGTFSDYVPVFARLMPDGRLDGSFNPAFASNVARFDGVVLQPDGKIVALGADGSFTSSLSYMARFTSSGAIDPTFSLDGSLSAVAARPLRQDVLGRFILSKRDPSLGNSEMIRINSNGSLDSTFQVSGSWPFSAQGYFNQSITAPTGKIYVGGGFDVVNGVSTVKIAGFEGDVIPATLRLSAASYEIAESDGQLRVRVERIGDVSSTATVQLATSPGTATSADFDGIITNLFWPAGDSSPRIIGVFLTDDALTEGDETFSITLSNVTGATLSNSNATVTILDDEAAPVILEDPSSLTVREGEIVTFSVRTSSVLPVTYQWQKNGVDLPGKTARVLTFAATSDTPGDYRVVVTSDKGDITSAAATLNVIPPSVIVDTSFSFSGVANPTSVTILTDGSVLVLDGDAFNGYTLRKFTTTFEVDPNFVVTTTPLSGFNPSSAYPNVIPLPNGQWLARGFFETINGVTRPQLARMNADGTVDETFTPNFAGGLSLRGVSVTEDGDIYAMVLNPSQGNRLQRILPNGSFDPNFDISANYSTYGALGKAIKLADGKLLISYTSGSGGGINRGIRLLNANGTFASGFTPSINLTSVVNGFYLLPEGRIAVGHANTILIYDATGALVQTLTFTGNLSTFSYERGHFIVTGPTEYNGEPLQGNLGRITLDGTLTANFPGGSGPGGIVTQFLRDSLGRYLALGSFTTWNGVSTPKFTRVLFTTPEVGFETSFLSKDEGGSLVARIVRYGDASAAASVRVRSVDGSAVSPDDFAAIDQVISWASGESDTREITITLADDELIQGDLEFTLSLSDEVEITPVPLDLTVRITDPDSLPQITTGPANQEVIEDGTLSLSVVATSPTPLTYQWFFEGELIPDATGATFERTPMAFVDAGNYAVELTNDYGTVRSADVLVSVVKSPAKLAPDFLPVHTVVGSGSPSEVEVLADGSVLLGGSFIFQSGGTDFSRLARMLPDGTLDPAFLPTLDGSVEDIHILADGSFLIVGSFTTVNGLPSPKVARFDASLTFDAAFGLQLGTGPDSGTPSAVVVRPDGKIVIGGNFTTWNTASLSPNRDLILLNADGSFAAPYVKPSTASTVYALAIDPASGDLFSTHAFPVSSSKPIFRWANDGTVVANYVPPGLYRPDFVSLAVSPDGTLLLGGEYSIRFDPATQVIVTNYNLLQSRSVAEQVDGRVVLGGTFSPARIARFLPDGAADPLFVPGTGFSNGVNQVSIAPDGSIWAVGTFNLYNGTTANNVVRLTGNEVPPEVLYGPADIVADPGEDVTFSVDARSTVDLSYQWLKNGDPIPNATNPTLTLPAVDETNEGDYSVIVSNILGNDTSATASLIVRGAPEIVTLSDDSSLIEGDSFTLEVSVIGANPLSYQWQQDGVDLVDDASISGSDTATLTISGAGLERAGNYRVIVSNSLGDVPSADVVVVVETNPAAPAPGFVPLTINGLVEQILPLPDGRALIGGDFTSISDGTSTAGPKLAVVDQTGAIVPVAGLSADGSIRALRLQADGKILIAGTFNNVWSTPRGKIARLNADLTLDPTFAPTGLQGQFWGASDIVQEAGGTIMVVGAFTDFATEAGTAYAVRLDNDGTLNASFTSGANGSISRVFPQADGDLIFAGTFSDWGGTGEQFLIRTDVAGVYDSTSNFNTGFYYIYEAAQLANGQILGAHGFLAGLKRFSASGPEVIPAVPGTLNGIVDAMAEDSDGRLLLGGRFSAADGRSRGRIVRYTTTGGVDDGFVPGTGFDSDVKEIRIAHNGAIWVGGNFNNYNGQPAQKLMLLRGSVVDVPPLDPFDVFVAGLPVDQRGPDDDPDGDRLSNLLEFAYGTDPSSWASRKQPIASSLTGPGRNILAIDPTAEVDPNKSYFCFTFRIPKDPRGVTLTPQATRHLANFEDGSATLTPIGPPVDEGDFTLQKYFFSPNATTAGAGFVRVKATR